MTSTAAEANERSGRSSRRFDRIVLSLAAGWTLALTWWVGANHAELRVAAALVEREGNLRGAPLTKDDHLSMFPELHSEFVALGLMGQGFIQWTFILGAFAIVGAAISLAVSFSQASGKKHIIMVMGGAWFVSFALASANAPTLSLLMWLNN